MTPKNNPVEKPSRTSKRMEGRVVVWKLFCRTNILFLKFSNRQEPFMTRSILKLCSSLVVFLVLVLSGGASQAADKTVDAANACTRTARETLSTGMYFMSQLKKSIDLCSHALSFKDLPKEIRIGLLATRSDLFLKSAESALAVEDLTQMLQLNPSHIWALQQRASLYKMLLKDCDLAIKDYTALISLTPDDELAYLTRGGCYEKLGDKDKARKDYQKSAEINPDNELTSFLIQRLDNQ